MLLLQPTLSPTTWTHLDTAALCHLRKSYLQSKRKLAIFSGNYGSGVRLAKTDTINLGKVAVLGIERLADLSEV